MRKQSRRTTPYKREEVSAMFEACLATTMALSIRYRLPDPEVVFSFSIAEMKRLFQRVAHEHVLALDSDSCFACDIPMQPDKEEAWLN